MHILPFDPLQGNWKVTAYFFLLFNENNRLRLKKKYENSAYTIINDLF